MGRYSKNLTVDQFQKMVILHTLIISAIQHTSFHTFPYSSSPLPFILILPFSHPSKISDVFLSELATSVGVSPFCQSQEDVLSSGNHRNLPVGKPMIASSGVEEEDGEGTASKIVQVTTGPKTSLAGLVGRRQAMASSNRRGRDLQQRTQRCT